MIDLLIAGAGPVGLATALYATAAGLSATVLDPRLGDGAPIDKACGEGLMPAAVHLLGELGIEPAGRPLRGVRYLGAGTSAEARFDGPAGRGVRRTVLHSDLMAAAQRRGVALEPGRIDAVEQTADGVRAGGLRARYLVAADGLHSPIRRRLGLDRPARHCPRHGLRRHYQVRPWSDCVEIYLGDGQEAYVTPVADDLVGVALLTPRRGSFDDRLADFPELRDRLPVHGSTRVLGAGPMHQRASRRVAGRVLLVGDAAGYIDAVTGEGISVGLGAARELVGCLQSARPQAYERAWWRVSRRYRLATRALLGLRRAPLLSPRLVPAARRLPWLLDRAVRLIAAA
jgi:flavin-dependent dehydrogenase